MVRIVAFQAIGSGSIPGGLIFKRGGAVEACWTHNPKAEGSKPSPAILYIF